MITAKLQHPSIVTIHEGPLDVPPPPPAGDGGDEAGGGGDEYEDCSLYMRRAAAVLETYLSKLAPRLQPSQELARRHGALAERGLRLFVRHALLVSGLKEMDKMRLVRDMTKVTESRKACLRRRSLNKRYLTAQSITSRGGVQSLNPPSPPRRMGTHDPPRAR